MSHDLIAAIPFPAVLIGGDDRISDANDRAQELLGTSLRGRHHATILRQPLLLDAIETSARTRVPAEARFLSSEARRDTVWRAHVAPVGAGRDTLVVFEDRTAMEEATEMRRDFVANVSHELRTPLTALLGFIETLRGAARSDPEAQARFLAIMETEAHRMNRLVRDLLSLNRVESEERRRPSGHVDLAAILRGVVSALSQLAEDSGVSLELSGLDGAAVVTGDADQLAQVATNLLENAIKYSGAGSRVFVSIRGAESGALPQGPAVVLTVRDDGEGFDPVHIPRLTERFYRIDAHRSREQGGTGLGLAIVKHIVNRHRGRLRIDSAPGRGAEFHVILPAYQGAEAAS